MLLREILQGAQEITRPYRTFENPLSDGPSRCVRINIHDQMFGLSARLDSNYSCRCVFWIFFFFKPYYLIKSTLKSTSVHCLRTHKFRFSVTFSLKIGPTILFTHLKIILLQCFQFQFSVLTKISSIQTEPQSQLPNSGRICTLKSELSTATQAEERRVRCEPSTHQSPVRPTQTHENDARKKKLSKPH